MYTGAQVRVVVKIPVKIIPELSAARRLFVWFASKNCFITEFLFEALEDADMLFSLVLLFVSSWRKGSWLLCPLSRD